MPSSSALLGDQGILAPGDSASSRQPTVATIRSGQREEDQAEPGPAAGPRPGLDDDRCRPPPSARPRRGGGVPAGPSAGLAADLDAGPGGRRRLAAGASRGRRPWRRRGLLDLGGGQVLGRDPRRAGATPPGVLGRLVVPDDLGPARRPRRRDRPPPGRSARSGPRRPRGSAPGPGRPSGRRTPAGGLGLRQRAAGQHEDPLAAGRAPQRLVTLGPLAPHPMARGARQVEGLGPRRRLRPQILQELLRPAQEFQRITSRRPSARCPPDDPSCAINRAPRSLHGQVSELSGAPRSGSTVRRLA